MVYFLTGDYYSFFSFCKEIKPNLPEGFVESTTRVENLTAGRTLPEILIRAQDLTMVDVTPGSTPEGIETSLGGFFNHLGDQIRARVFFEIAQSD